MMPRPPWDAGELARSALADMPQAERAALMTELFGGVTDLSALAAARNALTDRLQELIADRYVDDLLDGGAA